MRTSFRRARSNWRRVLQSDSEFAAVCGQNAAELARNFWQAPRTAEKLVVIQELFRFECPGRDSNPDSTQTQAMTITGKKTQIRSRFFASVHCNG